MDARLPERLVDVDISQTRDDSLIQQKRFDARCTLLGQMEQQRRGKVLFKRLYTQVADDHRNIIAEIEPAKLSSVVESNALAVSEFEYDSVVR
jgi:hypothetical protein